MNALLVALYALLIIVGGVIGYAQAHSLPSIIMGAIFGILLLYSSYGIYKKCKFSYFLALGLTLFLTIFFAYRFYHTGALFPAGFMALVSFVVAILLGINREK